MDVVATRAEAAQAVRREIVRRTAVDLARSATGEPYRYYHGWIPRTSPRGKAIGRALRQGNTKLAARLASGEAHPSEVKPQRDWRGRMAVESKPNRLHKGRALDQRYADHVARADALLKGDQLKHLRTDVTHAERVTGPDGKERLVWNKDRLKLQKDIVNTVLRRQIRGGAKRDRKALFLGGLPGAGKTRSLDKIPGLHESDYVTVNPDIFKEEMAKRGLVPEVPGLSPLEASSLVHEESSAMALQLAEAARKRGLNVIWDITMNKPSSVETRLKPLREAGYKANAVFVDIPHHLSVERVQRRHRSGWEARLADTTGRHLGQRLVPSSHVATGASKSGSSSANRDAFEAVKGHFDAYRLYNNFNGNPNEFPLTEEQSHGNFAV